MIVHSANKHKTNKCSGSFIYAKLYQKKKQTKWYRETKKCAFYIFRQNWTHQNTQHTISIHLKHEKNAMGFVYTLHTANFRSVSLFYMHSFDLIQCLLNFVTVCYYVLHNEREEERKKNSIRKGTEKTIYISINCIEYRLFSWCKYFVLSCILLRVRYVFCCCYCCRCFCWILHIIFCFGMLTAWTYRKITTHCTAESDGRDDNKENE